MTLRWRLRLLAAWYLLAIVDWLVPPTHTYVASGNSFTRIDSLTRCTRCWVPYVDRHEEPCQSRRQREIGTRPRLRKRPAVRHYGRVWERDVTMPDDSKQPPAPPAPPPRLRRVQ